jgi:cell division ATPase FtsA
VEEDLWHGAARDQALGLRRLAARRHGADRWIQPACPASRTLASRALGLPVRVAQPENLIGLVDQLNSPAYSTGCRVVRWACLMNEVIARQQAGATEFHMEVIDIGDWDKVFKRFLPETSAIVAFMERLTGSGIVTHLKQL